MTLDRPLGRLVFLFGLAALGGCAPLTGTFHATHERPEPVVSHMPADAEAARRYLDALASMRAGSPAAQAEQFEAARLAAADAPTTFNRLRYAVLLALPGHAGSDPVAARRQLSEMLARPELLLPLEQSLAAVLLAEVDERLVLLAETRRLQQEAVVRDKEHAATVAKRVQAEVDENARLRRALEDAQKKLEAVTRVEQSIPGRGNPPPP